MPRAVNLALALFLLAFLVPVVRHLPGLARTVQVLLVTLTVLFGLLMACCLVAAARPGALGRWARARRRPSA